MSVIQVLQNAAAPRVISCWKNIIMCLLLGKHFTVFSVIVMWSCVQMAKREGERKIVDVFFFFF